MKRIKDITTKTHALGVVVNKPRVAYDGVHYLNPSSIAKGFIDHIDIDPAAIKWAFENPYTPGAAAQDRMDRGTLAHVMLLQPWRLGTDIAIWKGGKRMTAAKDKPPTAWDNFQVENIGKLIISENDYAEVAQAVQAFKVEPMVAKLLTDLDAEVAIFSHEENINVKGLVDAVTKPLKNAEGKTVRRIIDLKTTEAGFSGKAIETTVRNFRNREKMAAYRRWYMQQTTGGFGTERDYDDIECFNVFLNMEPPYGVRVMELTTIALEWGERRIGAALEAVKECIALNDWPMFASENAAIMVADWELNEVALEGFEDE